MNHTEINKTLSDSKNLSNDHHFEPGKPDKFTAIIRRMNENELAETNCVWMNKKDIEQYFPQENKSSPVFARIANRVYKVVAKSWVNPGEIALSSIQLDEVETAHNNDDTLVISPYVVDPALQKNLTKATFMIKPEFDFDEELDPSIDQQILDADKIKKTFFKLYTGHFFREGQTIKCCIEGRDFFATLLSSESSSDAQGYFGKIQSTTNLFFQTAEKTSFFLSQKKEVADPATFRFQATVSGLENYSDTTRPLIYNIEKFEKDVRLALNNDWLIPGAAVTFSVEEGVDIDINLVEILPPHHPLKLAKKEESYVKAYRLTPSSRLEFVSENIDICAVKGDPLKPKRVTFKIKMIDSLPGTDTMADQMRNWIDVSQFTEIVREKIDILCPETVFFVNYQGYQYTLEVYAIDDVDLVDREANNMKYWKIDDETDVLFTINTHIDLNLIPDEKARPLDKIKLKISPKTTKKTDQVVEFDEERLKQAIREFLPKERSPEQKFVIDLGNGQFFNVEVLDLCFKNKKYNGQIYPHLGKVVSDTEIELDYSIYHMLPVHLPSAIHFKNDDPKAAMEELGLTGLSDHIIETIETIVYPLGELREWADKINIKPPKGLLLYGPPGTGKTTFADGLGKLLGIPTANISKISAKDIHNKWVGQSEKNLHKLFAPAIKAAENGSDERFIVFIDEIESLCANRRESTSSYKKDIVGALLAEMDGFNKLTNVMVIGTTNDLPRIDPAFLRPGRFSHVLEFPLPDKEGRKKILEYHTRDLKENELIDDDIDLAAYAELTEGCSGDHLRGLVMDAKHYNLRRLAKLKLTAEEVENYPGSKISKEDFKHSFEKLKKTLQNADDKPPPDGMYT